MSDGKVEKLRGRGTPTRLPRKSRDSVPQRRGRLPARRGNPQASPHTPSGSQQAHHSEAELAPVASGAAPALVAVGTASPVQAVARQESPVVRMAPAVRPKQNASTVPVVRITTAMRPMPARPVAAPPSAASHAPSSAPSLAPDASAPDVSTPDASAPDASAPDASAPRAPDGSAVVSTAGGAALMGIGMIVSGGFGYLQTIAMTHMVARNTYGIFVVVFTTVTFISQISKFGLGNVLLRFLPMYRTRQEPHLAAGLIRFTLWCPTIIGLICAAILFACSDTLAQVIFHNAAYATPMKEIAILIPLSSLQSTLLNGLCAVKNFKWQVYVGKVIEPVATPALMVIFFLFGLRLEALIYGYVCGIVISIIAGWVVFRAETRVLIRNTAPAYKRAVWMRFGSAMLFNQMSASLIQSTDVLSLGAFSTAAEASVYRVADRVSSLIALPFFAINSIFSPTIAELHARRDYSKLAVMFALVTRWSFALSWPIFLCCVLFPEPILRVFGEGYVGGSVGLFILAVGNLVNAATGPATNMLAMTGRMRILWCNTILQVVLNLVLIFTLVPRYQMLGAAEASSLTVIVYNIVAVAEVWWAIRIHPYRWELAKPIVAGAIASLVGLALHHAITIRSGSVARDFIYVCGLVLAFVLVYAFVLVRLGLTSEDREVFAAIRKKFSRG